MVNPLDTNRKLEQKGAEQEGEEMAWFSKRHHVEDQPQWVAQEQSKNIAQGLDIEANGFGHGLNYVIDKRGDCGKRGKQTLYEIPPDVTTMNLFKIQTLTHQGLR